VKRSYGAALSFYEALPASATAAAGQQRAQPLGGPSSTSTSTSTSTHPVVHYTPKCLCVLSHWGFFTLFKVRG
jgi:hypothetical protein